MTRYLTILGLALTGAVALVALANPFAGAVEEATLPITYTFGVEAEETAGIDGNQLGTNLIAIGGNPPVTCESIEYNGEATSAGPEPERVRIAPQYKTCHVIHPLLGTRTVTVLMNGCAFEVDAQSTRTENEEEDPVGETDVACPAGKEIEVVIYNTGNPSHTGAATLCTYKIGAQSNLPGVSFTNLEGEIVAHFNAVLFKGSGSGFCGAETAAYIGDATLRATDEANEFVFAQINLKKRFSFGNEFKTAKTEVGPVATELKTEKVNVKCTTVNYEAKTLVQDTQEIAFEPNYSNCTALTGNTVHVENQGCKYKMKFSKDAEFAKGKAKTPTSFEIACGTGKEIKMTVTKAAEAKTECIITLPSQAGLGTVLFQNIFAKSGKENRSTLTQEVTKINYEVKENPATCGKSELHKDGELVGDLVMKVFNEANNEVGVTIRGTEL